MHVHGISVIEDGERAGLHHLFRADLPVDDPEVAYYAQWCCQSDGENRALPYRSGPTAWDAQKRLHFHHPQSAKKRNLRACVPELLRLLRCMMDVQQVRPDQPGALAHYLMGWRTGGYVMKTSDVMGGTERLVAMSADHAAERILTEFHPLEPRMWLDLSEKQVVQSNATCVNITSPVPGADVGSIYMGWWEKYRGCPVRPENQAFLEWLQKIMRRARR